AVMHVVIVSTRIVLGLLILYTAIFLHEDEEGRLQNTLESWWITIADRKTHALTKATVFIKGIANLTSRLFDTLFGPNVWSLQAVGVALNWSLASLLLTFVMMSLLMREFYKNLALILLMGIVHVTLGLAPIIGPRFVNRRRSWWFLLSLVGACGSL